MNEPAQLDRLEERLDALEAVYAMERRQRDLLEKKYARLKRRYIRLERAHAQMLLEREHEGQHSAGNPSQDEIVAGSSPALSTVSASTIATQRTHSLVEDMPTPLADVIDLTSPNAARAATTRRSSLASAQSTAFDSAMRNSQAMISDDFCAESPSSPTDSTPRQPLTRASRRQLEYSESPSPAPLVERLGHRQHPGTRRRLLDVHTDPPPRPRPRLGVSHAHPSPRRSLSPSSSPTPPLPSRGGASSIVASVSDEYPTAIDTDEAASIALAQYLQEQENMAAMQEYEERIRMQMQQMEEQERASGGDLLQPSSIDPDNMTYEELLQLGERVGDVKKERWREVAHQVLSSLPTHRWTARSGSDVSCIICQYNFERGEVALTLPCAHVFHEGCVSGWVQENNNCPLCKLPIADV